MLNSNTRDRVFPCFRIPSTRRLLFGCQTPVGVFAWVRAGGLAAAQLPFGPHVKVFPSHGARNQLCPVQTLSWDLPEDALPCVLHSSDITHIWCLWDGSRPCYRAVHSTSCSRPWCAATELRDPWFAGRALPGQSFKTGSQALLCPGSTRTLILSKFYTQRAQEAVRHRTALFPGLGGPCL